MSKSEAPLPGNATADRLVRNACRVRKLISRRVDEGDADAATYLQRLADRLEAEAQCLRASTVANDASST
jgi:hypothetical protein